VVERTLLKLVMAITNRDGKRDQINPVRGIGYLDTCKYPAG
jgi:hypothetical protein